ncbi:MAG: TetR/AcrR family transcriptional regulator [Acidobacteriota bacterium]
MTRRPYHHGDLRAALVEAASALLETEGAAALSLRRVARAAGVSHAAPYRHFRDKHALLEAVAAAGFRVLEDRLEDLEQRFTGDPRRQILEACRAYVAEAVARPERAHLMFGGILDPARRSDELHAAIEESFAALVATVRRGEGVLFRDLPTRDLVLTLWSATHGLALLAAAGQLHDLDRTTDPEAAIERVLGHVFDGLAR